MNIAKEKGTITTMLLLTLVAILHGAIAQMPDPDHSIKVDEFGDWFNPSENSYGHYNEESGTWIKNNVDPDQDHSIKVDEFGNWFNPSENSHGRYDEESGAWIKVNQ